MIIPSVSAITATTATIALPSQLGEGEVDLQISPRADFQFCVCPIYRYGFVESVNVAGLNQRGTYWVRARERLNSVGGDELYPWTANPIAFRTLDGTAQATAPAAVMIEPAMLVIPEKPIVVVGINTISGFPASNLLRDAPTAWRAKPASGNQFILHFQTGGQPIDTLALLNTNLPEAATITVIGSATQGGAAQFTVGPLPARASANLPQRMGYHSLAPLGGPRTALWYRVVIDNAALPASTLHVEHLIFGLNRTSKNYASEKTETPAPLTSVDRKRSGVADRVLGRPMRKVDFELQMLTEAQYETLYADLWQRESEAVFVIPNTKANGFLHDRMLYGDLTGGRIVNPTSPRFNRSFAVNSLI